MPRKYTSRHARANHTATRFSKAVAAGDDEKELHAATKDLISVVNGAASKYASDAIEFLLWRQERDRAYIRHLEDQIILQQRHIQMIDRLIEQQAREIERLTALEGECEREVGA